MSIYGFAKGPSYRSATPQDMWAQALDQPLSIGATLWDQNKAGVLEAPGIGTAIRTLSLPPAAPTRRGRETADEFAARQDSVKGITEEDYKASPYFRDDIPWDAGMTEDRAAALAAMYDTRKVREYFAEKRPIAAFFGNLSGQALDPINYIPVFGPSVKAAAVARMGLVKGVAATAALDAAANTAIAGLATRETRRGFGDDVSWQMMVSEIATAALLGTAFGTVGGLLQRRAGARADAALSQAEVKVQTLKATQEARIALNEAIGGLANDGEVRLSPNAVAPIERVAQEVAQVEVPTLAPDGIAPLETPIMRQPIEGETVFDKFETGKEVTFPFARNPNMETKQFAPDAFGRDIEPAGRYLVDVSEGRVPEGWQSGNVTFKSPLVLQWNEGAWKSTLQKRYGATGKKLSQKIADDGYDGIVTIDGKYGPSEIVDLTSFKPKAAKPKAKALAIAGDAVRSRPVDASPSRPEAPPQGRAEAEAKVAKPENYKALADQYRVDPEAGTFPEEAELRQLAQEGRLSEEDMAVLDGADEAWQDGAAYGEALRSVANCLI